MRFGPLVSLLLATAFFGSGPTAAYHGAKGLILVDVLDDHEPARRANSGSLDEHPRDIVCRARAGLPFPVVRQEYRGFAVQLGEVCSGVVGPLTRTMGIIAYLSHF